MTEYHKFVTQQIANGTYSLSQRRKGKSCMWNVLAEIIKEDGSILKGLIYCRKCRKLLKFVANQTSNLCRHKCCLAIKQPQVLKTVTAADRQEAINTCVEWIIEDCRPFSSISVLGFMKIAKFFINIGATYGENVDVTDLLPDPTIISRNVQKAAEEKRKIISNEIRDVVNSGGATATVDMWSDNYVKRNFLGVTLHYQKDFQLFHIFMGLKSMDFQKSTSENILNKLKTLFKRYGVEDIGSVKFVTDRETNIVKALENYTRLNSSSHLFANVLDKSFEDTTELTETMQACKKVVKYLKKSNLQHKLPTSLINPYTTRWSSNYTMLKLIVDNWDDINTVLAETEQTKPLLHINISTLTSLVELCNNFEIVFKKMQACSSPSLCFALPSIYRIKGLCESNTTDISAISVLKGNISKNINAIWERNTTIWHKAAFFLFPPAASMQRTDIDNIKEFCISHTKSFENDTLTSSAPLSSALTSADLPSPSEDNQFFFSNMIRNSAENSNESVRDEVERYSKATVHMTDDFHVIEWWKNHVKIYPRLSRFALEIHSVPASSAAAERAFSFAGNITEKRNRLVPKSLDSLLFLHSFYKDFKKLECI